MKRTRKPLTKIQQFARGKDCLLMIPGVHRPAPENETTVLAHAPYPGRGGTRFHDWWGAPACCECHDYIDGRDLDHGYTKYYVSRLWMPAIHEWIEMLIKAELIKVKP